MVYLSKDTVYIYIFEKNICETAQDYLLRKLPLASLKQIKMFLHFSLKTVGNIPTPAQGKANWAKTRCPWQERANPRGRSGV